MRLLPDCVIGVVGLVSVRVLGAGKAEPDRNQGNEGKPMLRFCVCSLFWPNWIQLGSLDGVGRINAPTRSRSMVCVTQTCQTDIFSDIANILLGYFCKFFGCSHPPLDLLRDARDQATNNQRKRLDVLWRDFSTASLMECA